MKSKWINICVNIMETLESYIGKELYKKLYNGQNKTIHGTKLINKTEKEQERTYLKIK
jgi:hypothetical protein